MNSHSSGGNHSGCANSDDDTALVISELSIFGFAILRLIPVFSLIVGNVSEMTSQKGVAMGGNYELLSTQINLKKSIEYEKSERWLGFRCVAEFMNWQEYQTYLSKN